MSSIEWSSWIAFQHHYDLPDAYFVVAKVGEIALGNKFETTKSIPYFRPDDPPRGVVRTSGISGAISLLRSIGCVTKSEPK